MSPVNIWVNTEAYGSLVFVDNVYELVILGPVEHTDFLIA
jgi:hypothetical protein